MVSVQIKVISTIFLPFGDYRFPQTSHFLQPTMTPLYGSLQAQPAEWPAGATAFEGAFLKLSDKVQGRPMTSGNWLTQQCWFPAGTCGSRDCSQSCERRPPPAACRLPPPFCSDFVPSAPHNPACLPSRVLLPSQEPHHRHCSLTPHTQKAGQAGGKASPAEAPVLVGSPVTHGARESSQLTWQP